MPEPEGLPEEFCVRARTKLPEWHVLSPTRAGIPIDSAALILEVPEFLSMAGNTDAAFRAAMPAQRSSRVLVTIDEKGGITIVACPGNGDSHTNIVEGTLAANGRLWHQTYKKLAADFQTYLGKPLEEFIKARTGDDWPLDEFRAGAEKSLRKGRFPVTVVTNSPGREVDEAISYLGSMNLKISILGWTLLRSDGVEVVFPAKPDRVEKKAADRPFERQNPVSQKTSSPPKPESVREKQPVTHPENPWTHAGTKPGVMSGKRPPKKRRNR